MAMLTEEQVSMLHLINRSKKDGVGWSRVSFMLADGVQRIASQVPELVETKQDVRLYVRLTPEGAIVVKYI